MIRLNAQVTELADLIKKRLDTQQPSFLLALGSNFAGTLDDLLRGGLDSDQPDLAQFLLRASSWGPSDKAAAIKRHTGSPARKTVYDQLALLIRAGYFTSVITTAVDMMLEEALLTAGFKYDEIEIHILGLEDEQRLRTSLHNPGASIHIYKLYGSVKYADSIKLLPPEQERTLDRYREVLGEIF